MVPWRWQLVETRVSEVSSRYLLVVRAVGLRREKSLRLSDMLLCWLGFAEVSAKVVDGLLLQNLKAALRRTLALATLSDLFANCLCQKRLGYFTNFRVLRHGSS